jgi:hypothetical protein
MRSDAEKEAVDYNFLPILCRSGAINYGEFPVIPGNENKKEKNRHIEETKAAKNGRGAPATNRTSARTSEQFKWRLHTSKRKVNNTWCCRCNNRL